MDDETSPPTKAARSGAAKARKTNAEPTASAGKRGAAPGSPPASASKAAADTGRSASAAKSTTQTIRDTVTERVVKPARAAAETAAQTARDAAQGARDAMGSAASQGSSFSLKMIEHAEANTREAFNAMRAAAKSKDVSDVMKIQGDYLREQGARSMSQAREISDLIAQFGREAVAPLTGRKK